METKGGQRWRGGREGGEKGGQDKRVIHLVAVWERNPRFPLQIINKSAASDQIIAICIGLTPRFWLTHNKVVLEGGVVAEGIRDGAFRWIKIVKDCGSDAVTPAHTAQKENYVLSDKSLQWHRSAPTIVWMSTHVTLQGSNSLHSLYKVWTQFMCKQGFKRQ